MRAVSAMRIDVRQGLVSVLPTLGMALLLFASIDGLLVFRYIELAEMGKEVTAPSLGDCLVAIVAGSRPPEVASLDRVRLPVGWIAVVALGLYLTLTYPRASLSGFGSQLLVAGQSRRGWWLAKCVWVLLCDASLALIALAVAAVVCAAAGGEFSLSLQPGLPSLLGLSSREFLVTFGSAVPYLAQAVLALFAVSMAQLALTLFLGPTMSYLTLVVLLVASTLWSGLPFVGDLLMWSRSEAAVPGGIGVVTGCAAACLIGAASMIVGGVRFSRMDIVDKEQAQ